jgi:7-carboxy-7-deazaguanine synthase
MPKTLIQQNPSFDKKVEGNDKLAIAEMFCDTLQGESINSGVPATFIRLQGCTLKCTFCDTLTVWPNGNEYSFEEVLNLFESVDLIPRLRKGQHLVLTGGSPMMQQDRLERFIDTFFNKYGFKPYIEVENESVLMPTMKFQTMVDCWNNSPKLANSGMKLRARYKPLILNKLASLPNSWFKFVVTSAEDWKEIQMDFIDAGLISKEQIIVMPEGNSQAELSRSRQMAADIAIEHGVRFSDRLHISVWDRMTGV